MKTVQGFIPDWPGEKQHAEKIAEIIRPFCQSVTILDDPAAYMSEQWETARGKLDADILLWVMADVWPPLAFGQMMEQMDRFLTWTVGVYSPRLKWCGWQYDPERLLKLEDMVCEVPVAEMLCTAVRRDVVEAMPHFDPAVNKFGWGIELAMTAAAWRQNLDVVWDYRYTAIHPKQTDYDSEAAARQLDAWIASLPAGERGWINVVKKAARFIAINGAEVARRTEFVPTPREIEAVKR